MKANFFEGFVYVTEPNHLPIAFTLIPVVGPIWETGCIVQPPTPTNKISFGVLNKTYLYYSIAFQEFGYLDASRIIHKIPGEYPLPRNGCPVSER